MIARQIIELSDTILEGLKEVCNYYRVGNDADSMVLFSDSLKAFAEISTELVSYGLLDDPDSELRRADETLKETYNLMLTNLENLWYEKYLDTMESIVIPSYIEWQKVLKPVLIKHIAN